jgi:hypothetical protein
MGWASLVTFELNISDRQLIGRFTVTVAQLVNYIQKYNHCGKGLILQDAESVVESLNSTYDRIEQNVHFLLSSASCQDSIRVYLY